MEKKAFYVLDDFELRSKQSKAINYVAKCPKCEKWNLYISKSSGLYNCFTGGCEFKGILQDFVPEKPLVDDSASFYPKGNKLRYVSASPLGHPPHSSVVQSTELPSLSTDRHLVYPLKASFALLKGDHYKLITQNS